MPRRQWPEVQTSHVNGWRQFVDGEFEDRSCVQAGIDAKAHGKFVAAHSVVCKDKKK
jgi:hypothetical protein